MASTEAAMFTTTANISFTFHLFESQETLNLGKICQNSEAKIWKSAYPIGEDGGMTVLGAVSRKKNLLFISYNQ